LGIVSQVLETKASFEEAMLTAYKTALCSPQFLFRQETPGRLNDFELASRLSYFLWHSMPDDELIRLAGEGKLRAKPRAQAERLLADPRSERFVEDFIDQWLDLREIAATTPDAKLYPEFSPYLQESMVAETRAFFREMLKRDLSVLHVVQS